MHFSTVVVASLLAAFTSAEVALPAKRSVLLSKRAGECGSASGGSCCSADNMGGNMVYAECPSGQDCQARGGKWYCCPSGQTCNTVQEKCQDGLYGDGYTCLTSSDGTVYYAPQAQAAAISGAMEQAPAAATSAAAAATSAAAAASSAAEVASSAVAAASSAVEAASSAAEAATSAAEAATSAAGAAATSAAGAVASSVSAILSEGSASASAILASGSAEASAISESAGLLPTGTAAATGTESALPVPSQNTNDANRMLYSTPALLMAFAATILML